MCKFCVNPLTRPPSCRILPTVKQRADKGRPVKPADKPQVPLDTGQKPKMVWTILGKGIVPIDQKWGRGESSPASSFSSQKTQMRIDKQISKPDDISFISRDDLRKLLREKLESATDVALMEVATELLHPGNGKHVVMNKVQDDVFSINVITFPDLPDVNMEIVPMEDDD